jgi:hypothetical protein
MLDAFIFSLLGNLEGDEGTAPQALMIESSDAIRNRREIQGRSKSELAVSTRGNRILERKELGGDSSASESLRDNTLNLNGVVHAPGKTLLLFFSKSIFTHTGTCRG